MSGPCSSYLIAGIAESGPCPHPAGYQTAGDEVEDYCACHYGEPHDPTECDPHRVPDWYAIADRSGCVPPRSLRPLVWLSIDEGGDFANPGDAREWQVDIPVGGGGTFQTLPEAMDFALAEVAHALQYPGHRALLGRGWSAPKWRNPETGSTRLSVHRACNGCGRDLGSPTDAELEAAMAGHPLPDTREECGCS